VLIERLPDLGDDHKRPARSQHSPYLLYVMREVRPIIVGFNSSDQIEEITGKRQTGHGRVLDHDLARFYGSPVESFR
jgi:hypothetical protein